MIKTKVYQTRFAPGVGVIAITLFGLVFTRNKKWINTHVLNHEKIHCQQQLEWLYLPFFLLYGLEWAWYMIKYRNRYKAYMAISFEREAYANEYDLDYLRHRKPFANYRRQKSHKP